MSKPPPYKEKTLVDMIPNAATVVARLSGWFSDLDPQILNDLGVYHTELMRVSKALNLISPSTVTKAEAIHFADSILASRIIVKSLIDGHPVYDVGSGNGFPGIVFAILFKSRKVVLVERDERKGEFLKHLISTLKLTNASVQTVSLETLPANSIMNLTARGFAPISKSLLLTRKQVAKGGRFFHLKGDAWSNELASVPSQVFSFWTPSLLGQYRVPEINSEMAVVLTEKTAD